MTAPPRSRKRAAGAGFRVSLGLLGGALVAFLLLPFIGLLRTTSFAAFSAGLRHPLVWPAVKLSLFTTSVSLLIIVSCGTALAWLLAGRDDRLGRSIETLVELPVVVPPAVAGVALLLAFGRRGLLAQLSPQPFSLAFTTAAVVMAEVFVSAPFFVQAATSAFRRLDRDLLLVARSLGASPLRVFVRIALPLAAPGLISGAAMSWARSLGEFGATLMFAGNLSGRTQTLPLAIYTALESDMQAAQSLSLVLVGIAFALLLVVRAASTRLREPLSISPAARSPRPP